MGQFTVTFPATGGTSTGGTRSTKFNIEQSSLMVVQTPTAWTAAVVSLLSRVDRGSSTATGGTWLPVYRDDGSEYTLTIAASRVVPLDLSAMAVAPLGEIRLRSGTATSEVSQAAPRTFYVRSKP